MKRYTVVEVQESIEWECYHHAVKADSPGAAAALYRAGDVEDAWHSHRIGDSELGDVIGVAVVEEGGPTNEAARWASGVTDGKTPPPDIYVPTPEPKPQPTNYDGPIPRCRYCGDSAFTGCHCGTDKEREALHAEVSR